MNLDHEHYQLALLLFGSAVVDAQVVERQRYVRVAYVRILDIGLWRFGSTLSF